MDIEDVLKLKAGDKVWCPPDRGDAGYTGTVEFVPPKPSQSTYTNIAGAQYMWITVRHPKGTAHMWPSHRLG